MSKEFQASLASVKFSAYDSAIKRRQKWAKNSIHGRKLLLTKKSTKTHLTFTNNLDDLEDFWGKILWFDHTTFAFLRSFVSHYIWHKANTASQQKKIIPTVEHGGGSMMV